MLQRSLSTNFPMGNFYLTNDKRILWIICNQNSISFGTVERTSDPSEEDNLFFANTVFKTFSKCAVHKNKINKTTTTNYTSNHPIKTTLIKPTK